MRVQPFLWRRRKRRSLSIDAVAFNLTLAERITALDFLTLGRPLGRRSHQQREGQADEVHDIVALPHHGCNEIFRAPNRTVVHIRAYARLVKVFTSRVCSFLISDSIAI